MSNPVVISGIFSDPNGVPVPGAKIVIQSQTNTTDTFKKISIGVETDSTGAYSFSLLPGGYTAVVLYPEGNRVVLGEFTLQDDSPAGSLNDYLLFGEPILADPVIYSDIKKMYENILLSAAVVKTSADTAQQSELAAAAQVALAKQQAELAATSATQSSQDETQTQAIFVQCQNILTAIQTASVTDRVFFVNPPTDPDGTIAALAVTTDGEGFFISQGANSDPAFKFYIHTGTQAVLWATLPGGKNSLSYTDTGTVNAVVITGQTLIPGNLITVTGIAATNSGPTTIAFNGAAPVPITAQGGAALQGNELTAGGEIVLLITAAGATLIGTAGGNLPVAPGTASGHAATVGQLNTASGLALKTANHLGEFATAGTVAQADARTNIGAPAATDVLMSANHLSEIAAAGPTAQTSARTNIGAQQTGVSLLTVNSLAEITAAGAAAQAAARTNIGAQQVGTSLQTGNNLSEIAASGADAQSSARNNLGITPAAGALLAVNNLSEIAAAGPTAQAAAQANLGISLGGGGSGELLGVELITISQTYTLAVGTNTIMLEIVGGGSSSLGAPATSSTQFSATVPGCPAVYGKLRFNKNILSTSSSNTIIISIGSGAATVGASGNMSTIDSPAIITCGGGAVSANTTALQLGTSTTPFLVPKTLNSTAVSAMVLTVSSGVVILASKNTSGSDWITESPLIGWINSTNIFKPDSLSTGAPEVTYNSKTYFPVDNYGMGGQGKYNPISSAAINGATAFSGAVIIYMYS